MTGTGARRGPFKYVYIQNTAKIRLKLWQNVGASKSLHKLLVLVVCGGWMAFCFSPAHTMACVASSNDKLLTNNIHYSIGEGPFKGPEMDYVDHR